jgi:hypothetical protein
VCDGSEAGRRERGDGGEARDEARDDETESHDARAGSGASRERA